jgi:hypothetical protein
MRCDRLAIEEKRSFRLKVGQAAKARWSIPTRYAPRRRIGSLGFRHLPLAVPQLYVVAVHEQSGERNSGFIVFASKIFATDYVAVAI